MNPSRHDQHGYNRGREEEYFYWKNKEISRRLRCKLDQDRVEAIRKAELSRLNRVSQMMKGYSVKLLKKYFWCPFNGQSVGVELLARKDSDKPYDVIFCSAFNNPRDIACDRKCLELAEPEKAAPEK